MKYLLGFENIKIENKLSKIESKNCKELIIDFLYKLKDKFPFSSSDNNSSLSLNNKNECNTKSECTMDVFDKVMEFMTRKKLKPSKKLIKEYSESKLNEALGLPPFELVNKYTEITREVYEELKKRYDAKPRFIYYFNPDYEIRKEKKISYQGISFIAIGFFIKEANSEFLRRNGVCTTVNKLGRMIQAYYSSNNINYYGREFCTNKRYYEGKWKDNEWNGKGTLETVDGWKYIGKFRKNEKDGEFSCFKNGIEEIIEYKEDKSV